MKIPKIAPQNIPAKCYWKNFCAHLRLSQQQRADGIHVAYQRINDLVHGRRGVTASTALRPGKFFDTSPDFWMNIQLR